MIWDCPAAKWAHKKQMDVEWRTRRIATPPLFPAAPARPVLTTSEPTSLKNIADVDCVVEFTVLVEHAASTVYIVNVAQALYASEKSHVFKCFLNTRRFG